MADKGTEERNLPPSHKKLQDARKKGQVAKSKDITSAIAFTLVTLYLVLRGPDFIHQFTLLLYDAGSGTSVDALVQSCIRTGVRLVAPMFAIAVIGVVVTAIVSLGGLPISLDPIVPKLEKINPVEGFKRLFSLRSLMELIKTILKLAILVGAIFLIVQHAAPYLAAIPLLGVGSMSVQFTALMMPILVISPLLFLLTGVADIGVQTWLFRRDQRMGHTERKRETKDMEGDPKFRQHRRQVAREASYASGRTGIAHATFAISDGKNLLIALRYDRAETPVPIVVARARGSACEALIAQAIDLGVDIVENTDVANAIANASSPGGFIPESTYRPVAVMLAQLSKI